MEDIAFVIILLLFFIALVALVFLASKYSNPEYKGFLGEEDVAKTLGQFKEDGVVLRNCYIPCGNGKTSEIDLIMIHKSGIYVFECKNYSGWIFGNESQRQWTQSLRSGRHDSKKHRLYNPLLQNETHIKNLKKCLKEYDGPYYSYIVFGDNCELKDVRLETGYHHVINRPQLSADIKRTVETATFTLSPDDIQTLFAKLLPYTVVSDDEKQQHIERAKKAQEAARIRSAKHCPYCDGNLVLRTAKQGEFAGKQFWGCSNYPQCKYIRNITDQEGKQ